MDVQLSGNQMRNRWSAGEQYHDVFYAGWNFWQRDLAFNLIMLAVMQFQLVRITISYICNLLVMITFSLIRIAFFLIKIDFWLVIIQINRKKKLKCSLLNLKNIGSQWRPMNSKNSIMLVYGLGIFLVGLSKLNYG